METTDSSSELSLRDAVENLYRVFRVYDKPRLVLGCPHCVSEEDAKKLISKPLRDLSWHELGKYSFKAMTTFGDLSDFKRFLPRLLELIAFEGDESPEDLPIIVGKIGYAEQQSSGDSTLVFADPERRAIDEFLMAWWKRSLETVSPNPRAFDDVLESIGCETRDLSPYLRYWETATGQAPALRLAVFINDHAATLFKSRHIRLAFWSDRPQPTDQLTAWLNSPAPARMLEAAFYASDDERVQQSLSEASKVLEFLSHS